MDGRAIVLEYKSAEEEEYCDRIYEAALIPDVHKAKNAINEILSFAAIDVFDKAHHTAIDKLASKGYLQPVNFLMEEFKASPLHAAYGYALGGHVGEVKKIEITHKELLSLPRVILAGYAQGGHIPEVEKILAQPIQHPLEKLMQFMNAAGGYALGKHISEANAILERATTPDEQFNIRKCMIYNYARVGCVSEVKKLLSTAKTVADKRILLSQIIAGYTISDQTTELSLLLASAKNHIEKLYILRCIMSGYAVVGKIKDAYRYLKLAELYIDIDEARKSLLSDLLTHFAQGGYVAEANAVIALDKSPESLFHFQKSMMLGYALGGHTIAGDKILQSIDDLDEYNILFRLYTAGLAAQGYEISITKTIEGRLELLKNIAFQYARAGYATEANKLPKLFVTPERKREFMDSIDRQYILKSLAAGYAQSKYKNESLYIASLAEDGEAKVRLLKLVAYHFAKNGHVKEVEEIKQLGFLEATPAGQQNIVCEIAKGYAEGKWIVEANKTLKQYPFLRSELREGMIRGYLSVYELSEANNLLLLAKKADRRAFLKIILKEISSFAFTNEAIALKTLSRFHSIFHKDIVKELKDSKAVTTNLPSLLNKAAKLNKIITQYKLTYTQAMEWIKPELQMWFLLAPRLVQTGKFSTHIFLCISSFLSESAWSDILDVSNKLTLSVSSHRFFDSLKTRHQLLGTQITLKSNSLHV